MREDGSAIVEDGENGKISFFYIFHNFGSPLYHFFNKLNKRSINLVSIYTLGLKTLDILEVIHRAGYVHNDISLENIVLD